MMRTRWRKKREIPRLRRPILYLLLLSAPGRLGMTMLWICGPRINLFQERLFLVEKNLSTRLARSSEKPNRALARE